MKPKVEFFEAGDSRVVPFSLRESSLSDEWHELMNNCPVGKFFLVRVSEEDVRAGRKRPSIPAKYKGRASTKGVKLPYWGYAVYKKA